MVGRSRVMGKRVGKREEGRDKVSDASKILVLADHQPQFKIEYEFRQINTKSLPISNSIDILHMLIGGLEITILINLRSPQLGLNMLDAFLLFVRCRVSKDEIHILERLRNGQLVSIQCG